MTEIIKASTGADFLALVPTLTGHRSQNSVVFVMFVDNRTAGGIRIDLPSRRREADYRAVATAAIGMISRMRTVNRVAPVIYTDARFSDEQGIPWLDFSRTVRRRLRDAGFAVAEMFCVAPDGWGDYTDHDLPRKGRPLAEIAGSAVNDEVHRIRGGEEVPELTNLGRIPPASEADRRELRAWLHRQTERRGLEIIEASIEHHQDPSDEIERLLEDEDAPDLEGIGWLLLHVQAPSQRDSALLQIGFGASFGRRVRHDQAHLNFLRAGSGLSMDDFVQQEVNAGRLSLDDVASTAMMGLSTVRPDPDRLGRAIELLTIAISRAPSEYQTAPLCMIAWMWWALGLGSAAGALVDLALALDPDYGLAKILYVLFDGGRLPEWAFVPDGDVSIAT